MTIPQLLRAMNEKHVALFHPIHSGSTYYNYKRFNSIVLLALVDADYKFVYVDISCQDHLTNGAVLKNTSFYKAIITNSLNFLYPRPLPDLPNANDSFRIDSQRQASVLYVFVADDAFPISTNCMKPYAYKNLLESYILFNYRLSRTRRTTKDAFEILSNRFRTFYSNSYKNFNDFLLPQFAKNEILEDSAIIEEQWRNEDSSPNIQTFQPTR